MTLGNCTVADNVGGIGGIFLVNATSALPAAALATNASNKFSNNTAVNYGPVAASLPVAWALDIAPSVRTGGVLHVAASLLDLFNQTASFWTDMELSVVSADNLPNALSGFTSVLGVLNGSAVLSQLVLSGRPGQTLNVTATIASPSLALQQSPRRLAGVVIEPCLFAEFYDAETEACLCTDRAAFSPDLGACVCSYAFYMTADGNCAPCPEGAFCPADNNAYSLEGWCAVPPGRVVSSFSCTDKTGFARFWFATPINRRRNQRPSHHRALRPLCLPLRCGSLRWRRAENWTRFYECEEGLCEKQRVGEETNCREGHRGLLCSECIENWMLQGEVCKPCDRNSAVQVRGG